MMRARYTCACSTTGNVAAAWTGIVLNTAHTASPSGHGEKKLRGYLVKGDLEGVSSRIVATPWILCPDPTQECQWIVERSKKNTDRPSVATRCKSLRSFLPW